MNARISAIDGWLKPASPGEIRKLVVALSLNLVSAKRWSSDSEAEFAMRSFEVDLSDLPFFAIAFACDSYRRGDVGDGKWMPTAGQIRIEAKKHLAALRAERHLLQKVASAEIHVERPETDRADMLARFKALRDELAAAPPPLNERTRVVQQPSRRETLEETAHRYRSTPIKFSNPALIVERKYAA